MRTLFALLWKKQFFVLFILLEVISLILLSKSYSYHGSIAYNTTSDLSGNIYSVYTQVTDYLYLKKENALLAEENALLKNKLSSSFLVTDTQYVYRDSLFRFVPVNVVSNSVSKKNNFIMVNKGRKHGIEKEMGAISTLGITGVVIGVSKNYSIIMSMLHQNMRTSARIKNSGHLVNVVWDNNDYLFGTVIDIPSHIRLLPGDTIVTSGNSLIFPEGIIIGTIESHHQDNNKNLSVATLRYITDFSSLNHIYIINNLMKDEQDSLFKQVAKQHE
ncbi:MAG: rod shape-determining protein MreC [Bacteroidetes bacterium]|nr:rod shape-determining protein MreC [Bacteroidota bacterium]MBL6942854.1 rod shape-determining protein MreC [Bacteroidales bacterium]